MSNNIKYLNRDYQTIIKKLVDNVKYYYPSSINDFSPASPAMIVLQLISYVGDVLNYYIDNQVKQSILSYATQKSSVYAIAQSYGYKIKTGIPASVQLTFQYLVPTSSLSPGQPDLAYAPILQPGTIVNSSTIPNAQFTVVNSINFKDLTTRAEVLPVYYTPEAQNMCIIRKKIEGYSINTKTYSYTYGSTVADNTSLVLPDSNVVKILSVVDSEGNSWYEVDNMANDTIVSPEKSYQEGMTVFKKKRVTKRFRKLVNSVDKTYLYFGAYIASNKPETDLYKNFNNFDDTDLSPMLLILNSNYGEIPYNTTLTVTYYVTNQVSVNSMAIDNVLSSRYGTINQIAPADFDQYKSSLIVYNATPSIGGLGCQSLSQIKQNTYALMATQQRLVTYMDYYNVLKIMPPQYGTVGKSYVHRNGLTNTVQVYVLSFNNKRQLCQTNTQIKTNIGQFLQIYRMLGDELSIADAYIINVKCEFVVAVSSAYNKTQVLYKCINKVKQYFNIDNFEIGSPIDVNQIKRNLLDVEGVTNVPSVVMSQMYDSTGQTYSANFYDMSQAQQDNVYYTAKKPSIFELKNPDANIIGSAI